MRRAKYVAISRLTDDYLDITNWMNIIEGEAGDMDSLAKIVDVENYLDGSYRCNAVVLNPFLFGAPIAIRNRILDALEVLLKINVKSIYRGNRFRQACFCGG